MFSRFHTRDSKYFWYVQEKHEVLVCARRSSGKNILASNGGLLLQRVASSHFALLTGSDRYSPSAELSMFPIDSINRSFLPSLQLTDMASSKSIYVPKLYAHNFTAHCEYYVRSHSQIHPLRGVPLSGVIHPCERRHSE